MKYLYPKNGIWDLWGFVVIVCAIEAGVVSLKDAAFGGVLQKADGAVFRGNSKCRGSDIAIFQV